MRIPSNTLNSLHRMPLNQINGLSNICFICSFKDSNVFFSRPAEGRPRPTITNKAWGHYLQKIFGTCKEIERKVKYHGYKGLQQKIFGTCKEIERNVKLHSYKGLQQNIFGTCKGTERNLKYHYHKVFTAENFRHLQWNWEKCEISLLQFHCYKGL